VRHTFREGRLGASDQMATAWDIVRSNPNQNYATNNPGNFMAVQAAFQNGDACGSLWTAQTSLAASYGMIQVMYVTANDKMVGRNFRRQKPDLPVRHER
jgi:hypothetical protein